MAAAPGGEERFVLTGPTGWIGTAFLKWFNDEFGPRWPARVTLFGSSEREVQAPDGQSVTVRPLADLRGEDVAGAFVIHLAYLTKEKVASLGDSTFFACNRAIDDHVVAAISSGRPRGLFISSSGAARIASSGQVRELYGVCKLLQEDRFIACAQQQDFPILAGRIYNLAGPGMNKINSYAVSSFISQAALTARIEVSARTPVYRSYLHVLDLCEIVVHSFRQGFSATAAIDLCGPLVLEMQDVAMEVARVAGLSEDRVGRQAIDYARPSIYLGDPSATRTLALQLGLRLRPFDVQVADTASDLVIRGIIKPLTGDGSHG